ncbi:MAG: four helix bundle suffix domain-containing protein [Paludibacteraceae bacterium]|nr:four helix bundle suffix domain-containing protein [Paludibacteraceae bacterium]
MLKIRNLSFYWLNTWIMANVIQLGTQEFCKKFLNLKNDPCGRQFDQMTQAARSGTANIAEGSSRHTTSKETEMKLTDVARASLAELANDYYNYLLQYEQAPWSINSDEFIAINSIELDKPVYQEDVQHQSGLHILQQKHKFDKWLNANDIAAANCLLILCNRLINMLTKQIETQLSTFTEEGGFTEALTAERLQHRTEKSAEGDAPACPVCGKPMIRRVAKKGVNSGNEFWSCSGYPECHGTRKIENK